MSLRPSQPANVSQDADQAGHRPPLALPAAGSSLGGLLLADATGLRANWQRVQAAFVDDPAESVSDAADLVERAVQALVGALRQRQRQLREQWTRNPASDEDDGEETERLRQLMLRYRALFNQLCRP